MDDVTYLQESSTSDHCSQDSVGKRNSSAEGLRPPGPVHTPNDLGSRGPLGAPKGSAHQGQAGGKVEQLDGSEAGLGWEGLSSNEQGDVVAIMIKTAEEESLPPELREFWSEGSKLHGRGPCRPCHYFHTRSGCKHGPACKFCHIPHTKKSHPRPSQSQRMLCRRFVAALAQLQQTRPDACETLNSALGSRSSYLQCLLKGTEGGTCALADDIASPLVRSNDAAGLAHSPSVLPTHLGSSSSSGLAISSGNLDCMGSAFSKRIVSL